MLLIIVASPNIANSASPRIDKLIKSCDGGDMGGCFGLGISYQNGFGVKQDYQKAKELYGKACDGGSMGACFNLGVSYNNGQGVRQDYQKAKGLFKKACDGGDSFGCDMLNLAY